MDREQIDRIRSQSLDINKIGGRRPEWRIEFVPLSESVDRVVNGVTYPSVMTPDQVRAQSGTDGLFHIRDANRNVVKIDPNDIPDGFGLKISADGRRADFDDPLSRLLIERAGFDPDELRRRAAQNPDR